MSAVVNLAMSCTTVSSRFTHTIVNLAMLVSLLLIAAAAMCGNTYFLVKINPILIDIHNIHVCSYDINIPIVI